MLLELAVGDAYGAAFEYASIEHNDLARYYQHPRHARITPGCYTDDTQMSLAVAEALLDERGWTAEVVFEHFLAAYNRDPRAGYSDKTRQALDSARDIDDLFRSVDPRSDSSGAAMRSVPIGILPSISEVVDCCRVQAAITHNKPDGINAAIAAALCGHYFLYDLGSKEELGYFLDQHVQQAGPKRWSEPWDPTDPRETIKQVGPKGWMSVRAAITAITSHDRMSDLLRGCVDFGGDVDTVAAIALGAASCASQVEQDVPEHLIDGLENGKFGRDYIKELDSELMNGRSSH